MAVYVPGSTPVPEHRTEEEKQANIDRLIEEIRKGIRTGNTRYVETLKGQLIDMYGQEAHARLGQEKMLAPAEQAQWEAQEKYEKFVGPLEDIRTQIGALKPELDEEMMNRLIAQEGEIAATGAARQLERARASATARGLGTSGAMEQYQRLIEDELAREQERIRATQRTAAETRAGEEYESELGRLTTQAGVQQLLADPYLRSEQIVTTGGGPTALPSSGYAGAPATIQSAPAATPTAAVSAATQPAAGALTATRTPPPPVGTALKRKPLTARRTFGVPGGTYTQRLR
jgi:hypothetical protein